MSRQRIYLAIGYPGQPLESIVNLVIEENDRDDVKDVVSQAVDLIYDGEYESEGTEDGIIHEV